MLIKEYKSIFYSIMTPMKLLRQLEEIIVAHPVGITPQGLAAELRARRIGKASPATIRRNLSTLVAENRIIAEGRSVARIYKPAPTPTGHVAGFVSSPQLPLGPQAVEVQALVRRPLAQRVPVGYRPEFLKQYQPNKFTYLTEQQIEHLHKLGRSNMGERPAGTYAEIYSADCSLTSLGPPLASKGTPTQFSIQSALLRKGLAHPGRAPRTRK
jgi:hypothetical protein